ncbi:MAG: MutS-related protein [Nitritalea sp.]
MALPFETREAHFRQRQEKIKRLVFLFSLARLALFAGLLVFLILAVSEHPSYGLLFFLFLGGFIYLVQRTAAAEKAQRYCLERVRLAEGLRQKAVRDFSGYPSGEVFKDSKHPYTSDLDVFGEHSLFQLLNYSPHTDAQERLASLLAQAQPMDQQADARRAALDVLRQDPELLQDLIAQAAATYEPKETLKRSNELPAGSWKGSFWLAMVLGPVVGVPLLFLVLYQVISALYLSLWILGGLFVLGLVFKTLKAVSDALPDGRQVRRMEQLFTRFRQSPLHQDPALTPFVQVFQQAATAAGIRGISQNVFMLESRFNLVYLIFNFIAWLDFYYLWRYTQWFKQHGKAYPSWRAAALELEVLANLALSSVAEGLDGSVEQTTEARYTAERLRHPLLPRERAVANDFSFGPGQKIMLLTGANMSGKTTFMRTVGLSVLLVQVGLRPSAKRLVLGDFYLFTSMRNADNLAESVSSFYAEMARIRTLIERLAAGDRMFFLMDEIMKGTNTEDRIMGSTALIQQLGEGSCQGIISTHDIELSGLARRLSYVVNYSFHSEVGERTIDFDYTLKTGPCPSFNAKKLMELMGVRIGGNLD